jgi:DNA-binding response OmpR family regulator
VPRNPPFILIVEDELLVAMDVEATLRDQSWEVLGPVPNVARALSLLETETPDAVCLDMNLNGTTSVGIAKVLKQRGIPFVIVTGYNDRNVIDPAFKGAPIVHKPFSANELVNVITQLLGQHV